MKQGPLLCRYRTNQAFNGLAVTPLSYRSVITMQRGLLQALWEPGPMSVRAIGDLVPRYPNDTPRPTRFRGRSSDLDPIRRRNTRFYSLSESWQECVRRVGPITGVQLTLNESLSSELVLLPYIPRSRSRLRCQSRSLMYKTAEGGLQIMFSSEQVITASLSRMPCHKGLTSRDITPLRIIPITLRNVYCVTTILAPGSTGRRR